MSSLALRVARSGALVFTILFSGVGLLAQASSSPKIWHRVLVSADDGVDIRSVWQHDESGWSLHIQNAGTTTIHFSYYLDGQQNASTVHDHGRIHVAPEGESSLVFPAPNGTLVISEIRIGEIDEGDYWRE
jgi:hypothetical protein